MSPAPAAPLPRHLVLLRHAWAGERAADPDVDRRRPLDTRGRDQAARLPAHLAETLGPRLDHARLLSSPLTRCVATLEPLAAALDAELTTDERLAEVAVPLTSTDAWPDSAWHGARGVQAIETATHRYPDAATLIVCSHGEILPALLAAVSGRLGIEVPAAIDLSAKAMVKSSAWLVDVDHREVTVIAPPEETRH